MTNNLGRDGSSSTISVPAVISHDPPLTPSPTSSQLSAKKDNYSQFLSRLANLIRKGPPPKPHLVGKWTSADNNYSFENPVYGTRADVFPSSISLPTEATGGILNDKNEEDDTGGHQDATEDGKKGHTEHSGDENKVRGNWGSHIEFVLSCIGYAVGLGNVWRFPYLCYKNGGGSFLLIYWVLSLAVGLPIIFLELSLGQFTSQGPTKVWDFAPIVKGIGYSMCAISAIGAIYYNVIIAWALYYLFASFRAHLLWTDCDFSSWADYRCELPRVTCQGPNQVKATDGLCYSLEPILIAGQQLPRVISTYCKQLQFSNDPTMTPCYYFIDDIGRNRSTVIGCWNERLAVEYNRSPQFSTEQFYFREVLGESDKVGSNYSATSLGPPQKWLPLTLLLAWILVFICLLNGIKSSGKVVYFTALFPYAVLSVLIGRGVTLPGAVNGIMYFLMPKFEKVQDPNVWYAAASQLCFSLSACWGGMIALSSYNKFHTNALRDAVIVTVADTLTSFVASLAIFSVIGYGSHILQKPVDEVADAGTGLAFILYPKIIDSLPGSVAWAIMFFFMLLLLGLDSEFNGMETIFTALLDKYPQLRSNLKRKALAFAIFCTPFFLLGLPMICAGGTDLLELVDNYGPGWPVFLIGILETTSIAWIYGASRFAKDLSAMMPFLLAGRIRARIVPWIFRIWWGIVTPAMLTFILVFSWINYEARKTVGEEILGWCVTVGIIIWVPLFAIWVVAKESCRSKSFFLGLKTALSSTPKWGPFLDEHRREVAAIHGDAMTAVVSVDDSLDCIANDSEKGRRGNDGEQSTISSDQVKMPDMSMITSPRSSPTPSSQQSHQSNVVFYQQNIMQCQQLSSSKSSMSSRATAV